MAPRAGSIRVSCNHVRVRPRHRGLRDDPAVPSDPSPSASTGKGSALRHDDRFLFPPDSTIKRETDWPVAARGGVLSRDDGQLPRIGAAGRRGTGGNCGFNSDPVFDCRRSAVCAPSTARPSMGSRRVDRTSHGGRARPSSERRIRLRRDDGTRVRRVRAFPRERIPPRCERPRVAPGQPDAGRTVRSDRPHAPRGRGPSHPSRSAGRCPAPGPGRLFELVGLRRHAVRGDHIGHALDRASAIRWTRRVTHPSRPTAVPAMEVCLHPGNRAR